MSQPLNFDLTIDTAPFNKAIDETAKRINGFAKTTESNTRSMDQMFDATTENLNIQKEVIASIEKQLKQLDQQIAKTSPGKINSELRRESANLKAELDREKNALTQLDAALNKSGQTHQKTTTQIRALKEELIAMEMAGQRGSDVYAKKRNDLARLTDAMADATAQAKILAHDQAGFQGVISGVTGIAGAFSAAQGTMGLFVGQNENLQKVMLKVQSLMAITIGLQQVQQTLNKDSAFMLVVVAKAKNVYAASLLKLSTALNISNVSAKALMGTLTLGLSVAIGAAIYLMDKMLKKQREQNELQKSMTDGIVENSYKNIALINKLSESFKKSGSNIKEQEKFILENKKAFDELGVEVKNVADAQNLLIDNKDAFVKAQLEKAKSLAATELAALKYKELLEKEIQIQQTPKTILRPTGRTGDGSAPQVLEETKNPALIQLEKDREAIQGEIKTLHTILKNGDDNATKIMEGLTGTSGKVVSGIINNLNKDIATLKEELGNATSVEQIEAILKKIAAKENELSGILAKGKIKEATKNVLADVKKEYEKYYQWVNVYGKEAADKQFSKLLQDGGSWLEYLENQIKDIESKVEKTKKDKNFLVELIVTRDDLLGYDTSFETFSKKIENAKGEYTSLVDYITFLKGEMSVIEVDNKSEEYFTRYNFLYKELSETQKKFVDESMATFQALMKGSKDYAQQRINAENEYQETVKKLDKDSLGAENYKKAVDEANKIRLQTLEDIQSKEIQGLDAYKKLSGNINAIGRKEALALLDVLKEQTKGLDHQSDLYKEIQTLIKNTRSALKSQTIEGINKAAEGLKEMAVFASLFDQELADIINSVSQIASGISKIATGDYLSGSIQILTTVFSTIMNAAENTAKKSEEAHQRSLSNLKESLSDINELIDRQISLIDKLSGSDKITAYATSFRRLRDEIIGTLDKLNGMEVSSSAYRGTTTTNLDELIKTYRELFGKGRIGESLFPDMEIIDRLILENKKAIDDLYSELLRGEINGNNAEELKLLIDQLEKNTDKYEELRDKYQEYITGTSSESIINSIVDGFAAGKTAAEDFADTFEDLMKNAMIQAMKMKYLEGPMKEWYERFANYSEDGLTPEEIAELREAYNQIIASAAAEAQNIQEITGRPIDSEQSLSGAIKGVSEETAGLIAGQMNAIRMNQATALGLMDDQLLELSKIEFNTRNNIYIRRIYDLLESGQNNAVIRNRANGGS